MQPLLEERACGHHEHRHVDQPRDRHRDHHVDAREAHQPPLLVVVVGEDAVLRERRVQPDDVRHYGRAEDADGEQHRLVALELRQHGVLGHRPQVGAGLEQLDDVAGADREHHAGDHRLERAEAEPLQPENEEGGDAGDERRGQQADAEEQVHAERRAKELREVGRDRDRLGLEPEPDRHASGQLVAADFGEIPAGGDSELRR